MGTEAEFVEENESTFSPLDEMIKGLDGPDLEGDIPEGEVEVKADDKSAEGVESEKADDDGKEAASADEAKDASAEKDEEGSEEKADGVDGEAEVKVEEKPDPRDAEIANLRSTTRELNQELRELRKKQADLDKKLTESGLAPEEEEERSAEAETIDEAIQIKLETLAESMKLTEAYADLDEVVTEERYQDTIDGAVAKLVEDGYDKDEAYDLANKYVWTRPNPYKYLYKLIKDGHPDFKKEAAGKVADKAKDIAKAEEKDKGKKKEVAPTIQKTPGGTGGGKGGWTTSRIDDLPEDRLDEVPAEIYDKYLKGELD